MRVKSILSLLMTAAVLLMTAQAAQAVNFISAQNAHDRAAVRDGIIIDVRTVEEYNACDPLWTAAASCPTTELANQGSPEWVDTLTGVTMQAINVPFWISSDITDTQPEDPLLLTQIVQYALDAGAIATDEPVFLLCRSGYRSYFAGLWLEANMGFTDVYTIDGDGVVDTFGGMLEWSSGGLPVHFDSVQNRGWHGPTVFSVTPADGDVVNNTVTFTVAIMEPPWGNPGWTHFAVTRVSLYIDGAEVDFSTVDTGIGGGEYTFTQTLADGTYSWNVRAENLTTTNNVPEVSWNPNADDIGPGDRTLTVAGTALPPVPDIKANGSDGPLNIAVGTSLSVTAALNAGDSAGVPADWYVCADSPFGPYYYTYPSGTWVAGTCSPAVSNFALFDLPTYEVLNMVLPAGTYTFCFTVDTGTAYADCVDVNIQ